MNYKEEKKMVSILIIVAILAIAMFFASSKAIEYEERNKIVVDQFIFNDGKKVTINWNKWVYNNDDEKLYSGCVNDGLNIEFLYMEDKDWYNYLYEIDKNFYDHYSQTKEWRW